MSRAWSMIRAMPHYRHDAFLSGLSNAGFDVIDGPPNQPVRFDDVLCIWNRYSHWEQIADRFERDGGTVIVAENGLLSRGGGTPKFDVCEGVEPDDYYSLSLDYHNGGGRWHVGGPERWEALEIELKPWHPMGGHILVCPNRVFGSRRLAPPNAWQGEAMAHWKVDSRFEVRLRPHPGNDRPRQGKDLKDDLVGCSAMSIWASSAGVHALVEGVPVFCSSPYWICKDATVERVGCLPSEDSDVWDKARLKAMRALAWHQWMVKEIQSGEAFSWLLKADHK